MAPLVDALAGMVAAQPTNAAWRCGLGSALLERGDHEAAEAQLAEAVGALGQRTPDPFRQVGLATARELAAGLGRPDGLAPLVAELEASAGRLLIVGAGAATLGPVDRYLGLGARVLGQRGGAEEWLQRAAGQAERLGFAPWAVMVGADLASLGVLSTEERAALAARARALGMTAVADRIEPGTTA